MKKLLDTFLLATLLSCHCPPFHSQANKQYDQELNSACGKLKIKFSELTNKYFLGLIIMTFFNIFLVF